MAKPSALSKGRGAVRTGAVATAPSGPSTGAADAGAGAAFVAEAALRGAAAPDTLIPGATPRRPDNLLPHPAPAAAPRQARRVHAHAPTPAGARAGLPAFAREYWRHAVVLVVVGVALTMSVMAVWPVLFTSPSKPAAAASTGSTARATALLRTVAGGGKVLFTTHRSFAGVAPATLSGHSDRVPVVAATTTAVVGTVSMRVAGTQELVLATPSDARHCVFARSYPAKSLTQFVTVATAQCRASAAPVSGWHS